MEIIDNDDKTLKEYSLYIKAVKSLLLQPTFLFRYLLN